MTVLKRDDPNDTHFPIAAQKVFTCTEAAKCAPEGTRPAWSSSGLLKIELN